MTRPGSRCSAGRATSGCTRSRAGSPTWRAGLPARFRGSPGIGHTRWATHGEPSDVNAHPHTLCGPIAVVHNGIIENADELRAKLAVGGAVFVSETDTEVLAHLIASTGATDLEEAVRQALASVVGTYGIVVLDARAARPGGRRAQRQPGRARHRRQGDVRRLGRRRAGPLHPAGRAPGRRRGRHGPRRRLHRAPPWTPAPPPSSPRSSTRSSPPTTPRATRTSCARRSTSSRGPSSARCAAGSTAGSRPRTWAA